MLEIVILGGVILIIYFGKLTAKFLGSLSNEPI